MEKIQGFILRHVEKHPADIAKITAQHFGITRQAVNKHVQKLIAVSLLSVTGKTRNKRYAAIPLSWEKTYSLTTSQLAEDVVWRQDIQPQLIDLPVNVLKIWHYSFTEMFNNAIDHSEGTRIIVSIHKTTTKTKIYILDNGIGIFKKIQTKKNLLDERHAILELKKGKLTTDPQHHSGQGIFFTSRMVNLFTILSGGVFFNHDMDKPEDWILEIQQSKHGTLVVMEVNNRTTHTTKEIFNQYSGNEDEDYAFNKTVVPVELAQYGNDLLVSRSQAKRLLARVELFKTVILDFKGVTSIGQAFGDEIFRVFTNQHPEIELIPININKEVKKMITRAKSVKL